MPNWVEQNLHVVGSKADVNRAFFAMITSWDYPAEFYARLAKHWPSLGFICSVNGEMGDFGGIVRALGGEAVNMVRDYGDWRLFAHSPWEHRSMPVDAHFDDDLWFYFRTREEMAGFRARYRTSIPLRRIEKKWKRTR